VLFAGAEMKTPNQALQPNGSDRVVLLMSSLAVWLRGAATCALLNRS